ncbi:MAG: SUMF1/EgtB/PvdO family nonheme iron enzyme [Planctomycetota bacterium]
MPLTSLIRNSFDSFRAAMGGSSSRASAAPPPPLLDFPDAPPDVRKLVQLRQYATIVAPQDGLEFDAVSQSFAWRAIDQEMAYVPAGRVTLLGEYATTADDGLVLVPQTIGTSEVESVYLDRWCVSNQDYQKFVDAGGYDDVTLWPDHILQSVLQFVDTTMRPGPATWVDGQPPKGKLTEPVVGVSWYEANAYAQWVGKRLPTSAEWQRAGTWGRSSSDTQEEPRYPWGNSFDPERANTWATGHHVPLSVHDFAKGDTPNGVRQLIGNVWEWMNTQYLLAATEEIQIHSNDPMAEIRGGAFDSYFHSHTTCQSRSAQKLAARKGNVGFRCCLSADGLVPPSDTE